MATQLSKTQIRILAALLVQPRTIDELCKHWPRAGSPLKRLEQRGFIWITSGVWSLTPKGEKFWDDRLTKEVA